MPCRLRFLLYARFLHSPSVAKSYFFLVLLLAFGFLIDRSAAQSIAPAESANEAFGGPGTPADWTPANKVGFGTSRTPSSLVWFTLQDGRLSEVFYPDLSTPAVRSLDFVVVDANGHATRAQDGSKQQVRLINPKSPAYEITNIEGHHRWQLVCRFVTDPERSTLLIEAEFSALDRRPYQVYLLYRPQLGNGTSTSASISNDSLVAQSKGVASVLVTKPGLVTLSNGYAGNSDGWNDLVQHGRLAWHFKTANNGTVVQTGETFLTGLRDRRTLTIAIGFGQDANQAARGAQSSLEQGFSQVAEKYHSGWRNYLDSLPAPPTTDEAVRQAFVRSLLVLAVSEDKMNPGAYIASPSMPWAHATGLFSPTGPYHLVWPRDLYQIASALHLAGDQAGAERALNYLFNRLQRKDGGIPKNVNVDTSPGVSGIQLDETALPIILAAQLEKRDSATWTHVKRAAEYLLGFHSEGHSSPWTPEERWEEQSGYSPSTIASMIAALVCAADLAKANNDRVAAQKFLAAADNWRNQIRRWTITEKGSLSPVPYYLRLTKDGDANAGTAYFTDSPDESKRDQRTVLDAGFLELVRLGIESATDPVVLNSLSLVDGRLGVETPRGKFWYRYTDDHYGEQADGGPWDPGWDMKSGNHQPTYGRLWPFLSGERGEYELAAGNREQADRLLHALAASANEAFLLPEQVWDLRPPAGASGLKPGSPTFSATPLAWAHAQLIRLTIDLAAGRLLEQPRAVSDHFHPGTP